MPAFQLAPLEENDDLIDRLLEYNPKFWHTLEVRLEEKSISVTAAWKRL